MICKKCGGNIPDNIEICPMCNASTAEQAIKPVKQKLPTKLLVLFIVLLLALAVAAVFLVPMFFGETTTEEQPIAEKAVHARQLLAENDYNAAVSVFDEILLSDPDNIDAMLGKSEALRALDKTEDAEKLYQQAMQMASSQVELQRPDSGTAPQTTTADSSAESENVQEPEEIELPDLGDPVPDELYELPAGKSLYEGQQISVDDRIKLEEYIKRCSLFFTVGEMPDFDDFSKLDKNDALRLVLGYMYGEPTIPTGGGEMEGEHYFASDKIEELAKKFINSSFELDPPESYESFRSYENAFGMPCYWYSNVYVEDIRIENGRYQVYIAQSEYVISEIDEYIALPRAVYTIEIAENGNFNICAKRTISADQAPGWVQAMPQLNYDGFAGFLYMADIDGDESNELIRQEIETTALRATGKPYTLLYSKTLPLIGYYDVLKHTETGEIYYKLEGSHAKMDFGSSFTEYLDPEGNSLIENRKTTDYRQKPFVHTYTFTVNGEIVTEEEYKIAERELLSKLSIIRAEMTEIDYTELRDLNDLRDFCKLHFAD